MLVACLDVSQFHFTLCHCVPNEAHDEFVHASTLGIDVGARVTALEVLEKDVDIFQVGRSRGWGEFKSGFCANTTGAAHADFAIFFAVEIEQNVAFNHAFTKVVGSTHAGFFVDGEQCLNRTCNQIFINHYSQTGCNANAVVGAKGGAFGANPFAVDDSFDWVVVEIVFNSIVCHAYHVHVSLKYYTWSVFVALCCRTEHCHIADSVGFVFNSVFFGKIHQIFTNFLFFL